MKKKIIFSMSCIALLSILLSMVLSGVVSYYDSLEIVKKATIAESRYIQNGIALGGDDYLSDVRSAGYDTAAAQSVRVTVIDTDGTVRFDSVADAANMENHNNRPEVIAARENGAGESVRESDTLNVQSYNYAVMLSDGRVAPVNAIDLDHPMENDVYGELSPLLLRLQRQNETIKEKMEELHRKQTEFTAITENMREGFIVVDAKGDVLSYNTSAVRLLDVHPEDDRPQSVLAFNRSPDFRDAVDSALTGTASERITKLAGRSYSLIANPVTNDNGVQGAVIVLLDVTEKEENERLRREFTANVSHELKTPLTSISGYAEIMKDGLVKSADVPRFSNNIYTEAQRLITLVEDILKLSKLDENAVELGRADTDLYAVAQEVACRLKIPAQQNSIVISVQGSSAFVTGVPYILDEMLYNLADNAVKYNRPGGRVVITTGTEGGHAYMQVSDTGIGIPAADRERVFERFYRVDKSRSKQIGGTGLGLSIVKHGAMFHHARVSLESEPNKGTTVRVTF